MNAQLFTISGTPTNGANSVWQLTIGGTPTGGFFNIRQNSFKPVTWSANNEVLLTNIREALENAQMVGVGNVLVTEGSLSGGIGTVNIEFVNAKAKLAVYPLTIPQNSLTGSSPTVEIEETTAGVTASERAAVLSALLVDTDSGSIYINLSSTLFEPNWSSIGGGSGSATATESLELVGAIDGVNDTFVFPDSLAPVSVTLSYNGLEVDPSDYNYSAGTVVFNPDAIPQPTEEVDDDHLFGWGFIGGAPSNFVAHEVPSGLVNGINAVFTVANDIDGEKIFPFINGLLETHFTITGANEITFDTPPETDSILDFQYWKL